MGLELVTVGSEQREVFILGDSITAANRQNILASSDALSLAGRFGALGLAMPILLNTGGTTDQQRSAPGTTGIPSVNSEGTKATYSNAIFAFTPVATPTDFWALLGSGTKTIRVTRLAITGMATAAASIDIQLVRRSTLDTGSTPVDPAILSHDSNDGAATAVVREYTATNPTTGTLVAVARAQRINLGAAGAAGKIEWDFTTRNSKGLLLRSVNHGYYLNWSGVAVPGGTVLSIEVEWTEET